MGWGGGSGVLVFVLPFFLTGKQILSIPSISRTSYKQLINVFWFGLLKMWCDVLYHFFCNLKKHITYGDSSSLNKFFIISQINNTSSAFFKHLIKKTSEL